MKNFLVCIVLPFLVISCSTDLEFTTSEKINSIAIETSGNSKFPENQANPFDAKGKKYYELLSIYFRDNGVPNSIEGISKQMQFVPIVKSAGYSKKMSTTISLEEIARIADDPSGSLTEIVGTSALSGEAKRFLIDFLDSLIANEAYEYDAMYGCIVTYETNVMSSSILNETEKEFLLSVTAISRYSMDAESKHKDRDWEISVANRRKQTIKGRYGVSIVSIIASLR